jgi:hydroxymethylglutaryl-CoA lyase
MSNGASFVTIREVGPRDGLQSLAHFVDEVDKVALALRLSDAGIRRIEIGSFVSPRAVPQMRDTAAVLAAVRPATDASLEVLVPNVRGAELAMEAGVDAVVVVVAASDTFSRRNVGMGTEDALVHARDIAALLRGSGVRCLGVVAAAFGCAYEGPVPQSRVEQVVGRLAELDLAELTLADTTGTAGPLEVGARFLAAARIVGDAGRVGLHFHDTRGLGLVNALTGFEAGCRLFDASVGGLGGCPFSPGATGNVATEDLVHLFACLGHPTGIDLPALITAAEVAEGIVGERLPSHVLRAGPRFAVRKGVARAGS